MALSIEIKKIKLGELESFVKSKTFESFDTKPVTKLRVESYLKNPAASKDDYVLYLGLINEKLVAFRTFFAGEVNSTEEPIRFGWCSGNWVHHDHRRKGYSEQLLNEAFNDWANRLMFTNYAPNSESLYLKTGKFHVIHQFKGVRGYLFVKTKNLVHSSTKNLLSSFLFSLIDALVAITTKIKIRFYKYKPSPNIHFELLQLPDNDCLKLVELNSAKSFFKRGTDEFKWIFQNPWMTNRKEDYSEKYPFSSYASDFSYQTAKIFDKGKFSGFFIFSIKNKQLKTLHFEISLDSADALANFLMNLCIQQKTEVITIYNSDVAMALFKRKSAFLHVKKYGQKIYSSFETKEHRPYIFQDGDGDVIFT